jgi:hypothetical protein
MPSKEDPNARKKQSDDRSHQISIADGVKSRDEGHGEQGNGNHGFYKKLHDIFSTG